MKEGQWVSLVMRDSIGQGPGELILDQIPPPPHPCNLIYYDLKCTTDRRSALQTLCEYRPCSMTVSHSQISAYIIGLILDNVLILSLNAT